MRFNQGDVVVIKSPTSVFCGYVGTFVEYRKGKCSDICLVHLLNGKGVQLYIHFNVDTIERMEIIRDLRLGEFDVLVGINLLREGLDIPEVSLVAILDADKEGFLRAERSLIQTIGRAARNAEGKVIMYADTVTGSMERAIGETNRRRAIQKKYNEEHGIVPKTVIKGIRDIIDIGKPAEEAQQKRAKKLDKAKKLSGAEREKLIVELTAEMKDAARRLEFEKAAFIRDKISELRKQ